ncbi:MAG TPA: site-specific integrase [Geminicoccus sp.]|uniref:tyrosine-type recombinase/integrase n=1 Tax=Geminicoccus sp. TaxID=2024832 RepID=UPI002B5F3D0A|nr:site-specific integrase [Geminicoccus sp.]HWL72114.1 site-specific integrase [Geminicoccus sp.]
MAARRRADGGWLVDFTVGGQRFRKGFHASLTRRQVEAEERRLRAAVEARIIAPGTAPTLDAVAQRYWQEHGQHIASWSSERGYLRAWHEAIDPATPISQIGRDTIAQVVSRWRVAISERKGRPVTEATINRRLSCLQRLWRRAADLWGLPLQPIPWGRFKLAEPEPRDRSVPRDVRKALLDALPPRSRPLVELAFATGLRRGALLRLTAADLDFERGVILAVSKGRAGGRPTPVPMTPRIAAMLGRLDLPEVGRVFQVSPQELRDDIEAARVKVGRPDFRLHDTRHTFAQDLEDAGLGDVISAALHHSDPKLRRRYAHVRQERVRAAMEAVDNAAARPGFGKIKRN